MPDKLTTVFFDLDGTLADTAPDLAAALNQLLTEQNLPTLSFEQIRPTVSLGGNAMLRLGFPLDEESEEFRDLSKRFLEIYDQRLHQDSRLFPGMAEVLAELESLQLDWGIITNKSTWLTEPLVEVLDLTHRTGCIVCGDTTPHRKPHPAPMLHACDVIGCQARESVYIGDARRDITAGKASGMRTLAAAWGYIEDSDDIESWEADAIIHSTPDILTWVMNNR